MIIKIATWNVNSLNVRLEHVTQWLLDTKTDILLLQETKTIDEKFPLTPLEELGYNCYFIGQKSYNGVAIISRFRMDEIKTSLPLYNICDEDPQARYIEAQVQLGDTYCTVASIYVPNGNSLGSEKYHYKMQFLDRLEKHIVVNKDENFILGGDFNIAPMEIDIYAPEQLAESICFTAEERRRFRTIESLQMFDSYRALHPTNQEFSWWDYRGSAFKYNKGYRIDHIMLPPQLIDKLHEAYFDQDPRKLMQPSDHTPLIITLDL